MKKVTGIGAISFKCTDPVATREWYAQHLGFNADKYTIFEWRHVDEPKQKGSTVWNLFSKDTKYFEPSKKEFMINYRVENIEALVAELRKDGVEIIDEIASYDYGKFVHILDPEGNKIELWESADEE